MGKLFTSDMDATSGTHCQEVESFCYGSGNVYWSKKIVKDLETNTIDFAVFVPFPSNATTRNIIPLYKTNLKAYKDFSTGWYVLHLSVQTWARYFHKIIKRSPKDENTNTTYVGAKWGKCDIPVTKDEGMDFFPII